MAKTASQKRATASGEKRKVPGIPFTGRDDPRINRKGRPRIDPDEKRVRERVARRVENIVEEFRSKAGVAVDTLLAIAGDANVEPADRIRAAAEICDRAFGKPSQTTLTVGVTAPADSAEMTAALEQLRAALALPAPQPQPRVIEHTQEEPA